MNEARIEDGSAASDEQIEELLRLAYVEAGFTDAAVASSLFAAAAVRARGDVLVARGPSGDLQGMVIVVAPTSQGRRFAGPDEAEMHLLAVAPAARGRGIGAALVRAAIEHAGSCGHRRMILWTQPAMHAAQRLYGAAGFSRRPEKDFHSGARQFLMFERSLQQEPPGAGGAGS